MARAANRAVAALTPAPSTAPSTAQAQTQALQRYRDKRNFEHTPEPAGHAAPDAGGLGFVVQKHHARRLHYDFRLELDGVLLSWAVPKGPSLDPADKRMAVRTEDHPLAYASFEGRIPEKQYGAGDVIVWDRGHWQPLGDPQAGLAQGKLGFVLQGHKLRGRWELVRMNKPDERQENWLLFKQRDDEARTGYDVLADLPDSVLQVGAAPDTPAARANAKPNANANANATANAKSEPKPKSKTKGSPGGGAQPSPAGAMPAPLPAQLGPQLAMPASSLPAQGHWVFEDKLDGYRLLTRIADGVPKLLTRNGHDWTERLPRLTQALAALGLDSAWLDGEIVARDKDGRANFNRLQKAFDAAGGHRTDAVEYVLFDLPYFEGHDLRDAPLAARRDLLSQLLKARGQAPLQFSAAIGHGGQVQAQQLLQQACAARREGLVAKREDSPYRAARNVSWLKLKCQLRQEFVLAGYTLRSDDAQAIGSLLLAVHDEQGRLLSAGSVGTGWSRAAAHALLQDLQALRVNKSPLDGPDPAGGRGRWAGAAGRADRPEHWLRPEQVAEVGFGEWTPAGHVRHAVFIALRADKPAREVVREQALPADALPEAPACGPAPAPGLAAQPAPPAPPAPPAARARRLSHADRVVDAASGTTKGALAAYLDTAAERLLEQLRGRPVAMLRAPGGVAAPAFFQKHGGDNTIPGALELPAALWPGHAPLLELGSRNALQGAAQMNVLEFHPWNARSKQITKPDRMVFDLDPGEGVAWPAVQEGAVLVRALLTELGLQSWLKTSGGKGLHLVVPLAARWPFATVKAFSRAVVQHLAAAIPQRFVAKSGPANRRGRIFVDYLRNGEGATTVAAWSPRARPGLGVSMPLVWEELHRVAGAAQWTVADAATRLQGPHIEAWAQMAECPQSLRGPMQALGFKPAPDLAQPP